jgi:hypothetical protein
LLVDPLQLPAGVNVSVWVQELLNAGVSAVVLEAWTGTEQGGGGANRQRPGLYFQSGLAPVAKDVFGALVGAARSKGLSVYAAVSPRRLGWLDSNLGWHLPIYDETRRAFRGSDQLDLLNPAFQDFLAGLLVDLAATKVDGLIFRADGAASPPVGISSFGLKGFERDFGVRPDLQELIGTTGKRTPVYWQWVGWQAREQHHVLDRFASHLLRVYPYLKVILEVHQEAVVSPVQALERYGEDLLEARRGRYAAVLVSEGRSGKDSVLPRLKEAFGGGQRIWVLRPLPWGGVMHTGMPAVPALRERDPQLGDVGVVYAVAAPTLP